MHILRTHGLVAPGSPLPAPPTFGRDSPRRYGRAARASGVVPVPDMIPATGDSFPWVDQEFEEYFFE